jgi:hypothetical protein
MDQDRQTGRGTLTALNLAGVIGFAIFAPADHALLLTGLAGVPLLLGFLGRSASWR